ncbi:MAG: methionyl-tRNA formyltransferase [Paludibacterium sp.]|uniref:methionyl-tRNA formyltransferase n=1 Tax=Paludibacterium sp. TaxID=1917523 RepID=UPI0025CD2469|nr:methionyl-tRNA formyltransferase [Paludibacterium sp.]MBV8047505.1 methionyl-tRNA formyltransferase [Paludibacterium sp.]MBV8648327.1 methionyl-tRNA formyltransferase [Paludibacterium sp.]
MKLIFAGTPDFAACALEALLAAGHEIPLVLTQPDRPAGRGMKLKPSAVKTVALAHGLRVEQPPTLKTPEAQALLSAIGAEVMVVAAYGLLLPQAVLDIPPRGCLNIHGSLLPAWRGAAPVQRAIQAGDKQSGITIMQMDAGLDTGAMLSSHPLDIDPLETSGTLFARLTRLGAEAIVDALARLDALTPVPQPAEGVSYAHKISKQEALVDWTHPAEAVARMIRAFNPAPGAHTSMDGEPLKLWMAEAMPGDAEPGRIVHADADGVLIGCGAGLVRVSELQAPGARRLTAREFLAGHPALTGTRLG